VILGTFRGKVNDTDRNINQAVVETLAPALGRLVATSRRNDYVDLDLGCRWEFQDVASLGGRGAVLDTVASTGRLLLGGRAPKWAYGAALVRGLHVNPNSTCCVFDPKLEEGFVEIPRSVKTVARSAMPLRAAWSSISEPEAAMLHITVATDDRMLSDPEPAGLSALPEPEGQPAQHGPLVLSGVGTPNWVDLAYVRWLSQRFPDREIGMWDAATERAVVIEPKTRTFTLRFTRPPGRPTKSNT
jgi:hypothetical protein